MWEWLLSPVDPGRRAHEVGFYLSWHARLMVLAWIVMVPLGILAARYFKVAPGQDWPRELDNQAWWVTHRVCQYGAAVLMVAALGLVLSAPPLVAVLPGPHALMGWTVLAMAGVQILGGVLRGTKGGPTDVQLRGDHFDMTPRRLAFEYLHKALGYVAWLLAVVTTFSGLWQANAPVWMWLGLGLWVLNLCVAFVWLQRQGRTVDTYQAIWGTDPNLPGNRRKPIGLGVRTVSK
ncbi:cytochrome b561 domain-containing protein [Tateyamaria sp.]|uniref:cytochrome b561 domain-containing protein n=1 Tax=Tateyamaria sp. TaxID=1929288 RepID=UPI003B213448